MHPILVNCVSFAAYEQHGQLLEPERNEEERAMLKKSNFPLPVQYCPILLLNINGECRQDNVSHSLTNDNHTASAVLIVSAFSHSNDQVKCYNCGENGHLARNCRFNKREDWKNDSWKTWGK